MLRSTIRLGPKFIKSKDYVFEDKASIKKNLVKTWLIVASVASGFSVILYNFALPTPDMQFDFKYMTSPDFKQFVNSNGLLDHSQELKRRVRNFHLNEDKVIEDLGRMDYRKAFIEED